MGYRDICFKIYWKLQSKIVPTLEYSQSIYENALKDNIRENCLWLDLGCGHKLLPIWRYESECRLTERTNNVVGMDYDFDSLKNHKSIRTRVRGDISHLPFANNCFDIVTSNMVFEHLKEPIIQLEEIYRILKPGGTLLFHTTNSFGYCTIGAKIVPAFIKDRLVWILEGRKEEDVFPAYYRINSPKTIRKLAELAGFHISQIKMISSSAQFVMIPPLVFFELFLLRILMSKRLEALRTNIIATLIKPQSNQMVHDQIDPSGG